MNTRLLVSLMIIGFVGVGLGSTTMAMFNDTETSSNNQFTAGELDLTVDWEESYNGEHVETQNLTNDPGTIFELGDMKPGDYGEATVSLHLDDNPGWIWMNLNQTANWDNACTEPERKAEGQCGSEGELDEELEFTIWADDGDNVKQEDEKVIFEGTAQELEEASTSEGILLDGNPSTNETEAFSGGETSYVGIKYNIPLETGNHIQGDSLKYDISFYTEQRRHNDNPENPWSDSDNNETEEPENEPPVASFERANDEPFSTTVGNEVRLFSTSTDDKGIEKRKWDLGDGTTKFGQDVWHNWSEAGNYTVTLEVTDTDGETDTASNVMEVTEDEDSGNETETPGDENETEEPVEPTDTLSFEGQQISEEGTVTVNDVTTNQASTVFVTYETDEGLVNAGVHGATNIEDFDGMNIEINDSAVPGPYTAHIIPTSNISSSYSTGDVLSNSTASASIYSETAEISEAANGANETEFTATQGNETTEITPIEGDETVQEFYDFRLPDNYDNEANRNATNGASYGGSTYGSAGTEDLQQADTSLMFLYDGPEGLSLVVVHEGVGSDDGGSATFEITGLEDGEWVVKDDYYLDSDGSIASSNYDRWNTSSNPQTIDWTWGGAGSDGGAFQPLADDFEFTIDPAFNEEAGLYDDNFYDGDVEEWQVVSGDRDNPDRTTLNMSEEVTITAE